MPVHKNKKWRQAVTVLAWAALLTAYLLGLSSRGQEHLDRLRPFFPEVAGFERINASPLIYRLSLPEGQGAEPGYLAVGEAYGYGGPLTVATHVSQEGSIVKVLVLSHKETPAFMNRVMDNGFLDGFSRKPANAQLRSGQDLQAVTGASVTASALAQAVRQGSYGVAAKYLALELPQLKNHPGFELDLKEYILLLLLGVMLGGAYMRWNWLRYLTLAGGLAFLGFYLNSGLSLANLATLLLGYIPPLAEKSFWWILVGGVLLITFLFGKNLYCNWLCPAAAIQEITARIGGLNIKLSGKTIRLLARLRSGLLWCCLLMIFLTSNPGITAFNPFATLFGLEGVDAQWLLLPVVILGSFLFNRFWCRIFCPVGTLLSLLGRLGAKVRKILKHRKSGKEESDAFYASTALDTGGDQSGADCRNPLPISEQGLKAGKAS